MNHRFSGRFAQGLPGGSCSRPEGIVVGVQELILVRGGGERESVAIAKPALALLPSTAHALVHTPTVCVYRHTGHRLTWESPKPSRGDGRGQPHSFATEVSCHLRVPPSCTCN